MARLTSGLWAQSVTSWADSASIFARAVPQLPAPSAPMVATLAGSFPPPPAWQATVAGWRWPAVQAIAHPSGACGAPLFRAREASSDSHKEAPSRVSLKYAILSLLAHAPLSGYELMKLFDRSVGYFWDGA